MARALRLLAQREHSRAELERKLLAREARARGAATGPEALADEAPHELRGDVSQVLDTLERDGWLNDQRAAESLVQVRSARYGARRIGQLLRERSFDTELIARSLETVRAGELERARAVWTRRFGQAAADPKQRARQMRFLIGRGFDAAIAAQVVRGAAVGDDAAPSDEPAD